MIEDVWNKEFGQTITIFFGHTKIDCQKNRTDCNELTAEDFIKTQTKNLLIFFVSQNELNKNLVIDKDVETLGIENEDKQEIDSKPSITLDVEENKWVDITRALNSLKILKNFYYGKLTYATMYLPSSSNLLEIEQNFHEKYCKGKLRQKQIMEYFKQF